MSKITCINCEKDTSQHYWMCDEPDQDGEWCPECWENTACCAGVHGEGCPTQVFGDAAPAAPAPANPVSSGETAHCETGTAESQALALSHSQSHGEV